MPEPAQTVPAVTPHCFRVSATRSRRPTRALALKAEWVYTPGMSITHTSPPDHTSHVDDRPLRPALWRGWRRKCPACGEGPLLSGYLTVRQSCPSCGEAFHHQRADDGPAYITILIVGHALAPVLHLGYVWYEPSPAVLALVMCTMAAVLSLWLLPRIKGAFVALQWSRRMHGFGRPTEAVPPPQ